MKRKVAMKQYNSTLLIRLRLYFMNKHEAYISQKMRIADLDNNAQTTSDSTQSHGGTFKLSLKILLYYF